VFAGWRRDRLTRVRANIESEFHDVLRKAPELEARVRSGQRMERFLGATDLPNFLRLASGPGWALVGDAGCHKDPTLALGICDAFRDAERLAKAIDAGLSGTLSMDGALADYARDRDAATMDDYRENLLAAQLGPLPDEMMRTRARLQYDPLATRHFYLARQGLLARGV
jgi:flavin-dependent dehydrogenase